MGNGEQGKSRCGALAVDRRGEQNMVDPAVGGVIFFVPFSCSRTDSGGCWFLQFPPPKL